MASKQSHSQDLRLLTEMKLLGKLIFDVEDAAAVAQEIGIQRSQLNKMLSRLTKKGWLIRLRRGLYAGFGILPGQIQTHPFAIACRLVQPSAISHWSALQYHGLTEQIPQIVTATTTGRTYPPSVRKKEHQSRDMKHAWEIAEVRYEFITVKEAHFFGIENIWIDENFLIPITDKERTLLDVFVNLKMFGGFGEALGIVESSLYGIDIKKLVEYAIRLDNKSVIKRLGWALDYFGVSKKLVAPLLRVPVKSYCRLDPCGPAVGVYEKRWMILNNLKR